MKIGELAALTHCSIETIRYYEKEGLLPAAARSQANYRFYGPAHIERMRFLRNCRSLDMSHDEIRRLLQLVEGADADCNGVNDLLDEHIQHVAIRIQELTSLQQQLLSLRNQCSGTHRVDECAIVKGLSEMEAESKPVHHSHLG